MVSFDEAGEMLDTISDSLPFELYRELNGGIVLVPEFKYHPKSIENDLYILGEYHRSLDMGRYIVIYYGSFEKVFGNCSREQWYEELRKVLVHEVRHHNEGLAGYRDLEVYDEDQIAGYLASKVRQIKISDNT
ncbi:MAG: metallopeptidase family protein [Bacillota bacterium]|nr:metallopeptidase family protein [Bacillota bacterium]